MRVNAGTASGAQAAAQQRFGEGGKIIEYRHARSFWDGNSLCPVAGAHQDRQCTCRMRCFQVASRIADDVYGAQAHLQSLRHILEQARHRFSTTTAVVVAMRAEEDRLDLAATLAHSLDHFDVYAVQGFDAEEAAFNS